MAEDSTEGPERAPQRFPGEDITDRPLECTECRKPVSIWYTEIVGTNTAETVMCSDCPCYLRRLHGEVATEGAPIDSATGLCCGTCGTTLDAIRTGHLLGCAHCYDVFEDVIITDLLASKKMASRQASAKRTVPLHAGRSPGEVVSLSPNLRLVALNEALKETLTREDYEQAAWLRDQIKTLEERNPSGDKPSGAGNG